MIMIKKGDMVDVGKIIFFDPKNEEKYEKKVATVTNIEIVETYEKDNAALFLTVFHDSETFEYLIYESQQEEFLIKDFKN